MWLQQFRTDVLDVVYMYLLSVTPKPKLRVAEKKSSNIHELYHVVGTKLRAVVPKFCSFIIDTLECIQKVSLLVFCFQAPFSFCCQQSKPKFSGCQVEVFPSIKWFAFSTDVVYLSAFMPPTVEIT